MCFGGQSAPVAPVETPSVPVDQISAGQPTVTVSPADKAAAAASASATPAAPAASQNAGSTGLNM